MDPENDALDDDEVVEDVDAKVLDTKDRDSLGSDKFAVPGKRKLPIHDAAHVRNALARFNQTKGLTPAERSAARAAIHRAAKKFGIKVDAEEGGDEGIAISAMRIEAVSLDMPDFKDHPNRMPFRGILTRIDEPSDKAPNGSGGKRVMITRAAAIGALPSLLGMGVDLTKDLNGHDAQNKVGVITKADIDGNAITIEGFIYAADFPHDALRIHMNQADLGFSFEAQQLRVESVDTDPIVVKSCIFTGAAILMKNDAAYTTTALAAAAAKEREKMDEVAQAVTAAIAAAMAPVTEQLTALKAGQDAQQAALTELQKGPPMVHAVNAAMAKVEPHAGRLEAAAAQMEKEGIGLHASVGHVHFIRRLADSMRADAARGKMPHEYHEGSYFGASAAPLVQQVAAPKVEDLPEYKALKASAEANAQALKEAQDAIASQATVLKDLKAASDQERQGPQRRTLTPEVLGALSRIGISAPEEGDQKGIDVFKIDAALDTMKDRLNTEDRIRLKTILARGGMVAQQ